MSPTKEQISAIIKGIMLTDEEINNVLLSKGTHYEEIFKAMNKYIIDKSKLVYDIDL